MLQTAAVLPVQRVDTFFKIYTGGGRGGREGSILHVMPPSSQFLATPLITADPRTSSFSLVGVHHTDDNLLLFVKLSLSS
jgi:hypothetical protein